MESDFEQAERRGRNKGFGAHYNDSDIYADQNLNVYPNTRFLSQDDQDFKGTPRTSKYFKGRQLDIDNNLV